MLEKRDCCAKHGLVRLDLSSQSCASHADQIWCLSPFPTPCGPSWHQHHPCPSPGAAFSELTGIRSPSEGSRFFRTSEKPLDNATNVTLDPFFSRVLGLFNIRKLSCGIIVDDCEPPCRSLELKITRSNDIARPHSKASLLC